MPVTDTLKTAPAVTCMKTLLMVFNFIFWVTGVAILALGIWMKVQLYKYIQLTTVYYHEAPYVLIGVGAGIVIVGSLGCLCTVKGKSVLLYMYAGFMFIVFIAEFAVAIAAFVFRGKLEKGFKDGLSQAINLYGKDKGKTSAIDDLQKALKCCGSANYTDWDGTDYYKNNKQFPPSCCINTGCDSKNSSNIYNEGCYTKVTTFMQKNFSLIGGVAIGFSFLQLFGSLLACSLAKNINKAKYEQVA